VSLSDQVLTVPQAAKLLGVGVRTYYQAASRGEVPAIRIGRRLVVPGAQLTRLLEGEALDRAPSMEAMTREATG
jgi:excisionase family DNA binding protein